MHMSSDENPVSRRTYLAGIGASVVAASGLASGSPPGRPGDEILVGVSPGASARATVEPAVPSSAEIVHENDTLRYVTVRFTESASDRARRQFVDNVTNRPSVAYAEANAVFEPTYAPNDPYEPDEPSLDLIDARKAWDTGLDESDTTIGIVDTGVQYDHPDLDPNVGSNPGRDFVSGDSDPYPPSGEVHGTHVAGIAAAATDDAFGVAGVSNATLLCARALSSYGGRTSDIADTIQWVTDQGADVINMSFGGGGYSSTMQNAVSYAYDNDVLPVAAAGNDGNNTVSYPARYDEVLAVSAVDAYGNLASFTNTGSSVELAAPGVDYLSTYPTDSFSRLSGTSMSSPVVAGVAAMVQSRYGTGPYSTRKQLKETARDSALSSEEEGAGIVSAGAAVRQFHQAVGAYTAAGRASGQATGAQSLQFEWPWVYGTTTELELTLSDPDYFWALYVNTSSAGFPTSDSHDHGSDTATSGESVTISDPDTSRQSARITIDTGYVGYGGSYSLDVSEDGY